MSVRNPYSNPALSHIATKHGQLERNARLVCDA
jgi:hypothetical protein